MNHKMSQTIEITIEATARCDFIGSNEPGDFSYLAENVEVEGLTINGWPREKIIDVYGEKFYRDIMEMVADAALDGEWDMEE